MVEANSYLQSLSKALTLPDLEVKAIDKSIGYLKEKIWGVFQNKLIDISVFGSYDRGTSLPGNIDKKSDVDLMVKFKENEYQPQTYLNQLRKFSENTYPKSDVFSDHPTIVVELNHVKFELVPAYMQSAFLSNDKLMIPASPRKEVKWIETDHDGFKKSLIKKNQEKEGLTIPIIKILKYWNSLNNYAFSSFQLERIAVNDNVTGKDLLYCLDDFIKEISRYNLEDEEQKAFDKLKEKNRRLWQLISGNIPEYVEEELKSFLPMP